MTTAFRTEPRALALAGAFFLAVATGGAAFAHPGWGIEADSRGNVYFADVHRLAVWRLSAEGELSKAAAGVWTHEILVDAADNVFFEHEDYVGPPAMVGYPPRLEEAGARVVSFHRLGADGSRDVYVPPTPSAHPSPERPRVSDNFANGLTLLRDAAGDSWGFVHGADSEFPRLVRRSPGTLEGEAIVVQERVWVAGEGGGRLPFDLRGPQSACWGRDGSIILTAGGSAWRVSPADGSAERIGPPPPERAPGEPGYARTTRALGATEDAEGRVFVANYWEGKVVSISPGGEASTFRQSPAGWSPLGVEALEGGDALILETRPVLAPGPLSGDPPLRVVRAGAEGAETVLVLVDDAAASTAPMFNGPPNQK